MTLPNAYRSLYRLLPGIRPYHARCSSRHDLFDTTVICDCGEPTPRLGGAHVDLQ